MQTTEPPDGVPERIPVTLALEGGGALGAFTWGVLDRLLDEPTLSIGVVSGTSAGAMNGAMLVQGLMTGGPDRAKRLLETLWHRVAIAAGSLPGTSGFWMQAMSGSLAPMLNAVRRTPGLGAAPGKFSAAVLRGILSELLHPSAFGAPDAPELVVAATAVRTGQTRLFRRGEVTIDALLASSCLPQLFDTVEIDGEAYWDGGYSSNPPVRPLIEAGAPSDVLIVRTLPAARPMLPYGVDAVTQRIAEITFGTPLRTELHSLALAQHSLAGLADLPPTLARLRDARIHMIAPADEDTTASALHPSWSSIAELHRLGLVAAETWLASHRQAIGRRSSLSLESFADLESQGGPTISDPYSREEPTHAA